MHNMWTQPLVYKMLFVQYWTSFFLQSVIFFCYFVLILGHTFRLKFFDKTKYFCISIESQKDAGTRVMPQLNWHYKMSDQSGERDGWQGGRGEKEEGLGWRNLKMRIVHLKCTHIWGIDWKKRLPCRLTSLM